MTSIKIKLHDMNSVQSLVNICSKFTFDIDLASSTSRQIVDAKSITGVLTLNLSQELIVTLHTIDIDEVNSVRDAIKDYIV